MGEGSRADEHLEIASNPHQVCSTQAHIAGMAGMGTGSTQAENKYPAHNALLEDRIVVATIAEKKYDSGAENIDIKILHQGSGKTQLHLQPVPGKADNALKQDECLSSQQFFKPGMLTRIPQHRHLQPQGPPIIVLQHVGLQVLEGGVDTEVRHKTRVGLFEEENTDSPIPSMLIDTMGIPEPERAPLNVNQTPAIASDVTGAPAHKVGHGKDDPKQQADSIPGVVFGHGEDDPEQQANTIPVVVNRNYENCSNEQIQSLPVGEDEDEEHLATDQHSASSLAVKKKNLEIDSKPRQVLSDPVLLWEVISSKLSHSDISCRASGSQQAVQGPAVRGDDNQGPRKHEQERKLPSVPCTVKQRIMMISKPGRLSRQTDASLEVSQRLLVGKNGYLPDLEAGEMVTGDAGLPIRLNTEVGTNTCNESFEKVNIDNNVPPMLAHTLAVRNTSFPSTDDKPAVGCTQDQEAGETVTGDTELPVPALRTHGCKVEFIKVNSDNDEQPVLALTLRERCNPLTNTDVRRMPTMVPIPEGEDNSRGDLGEGDADRETEHSYNSMISKVTNITPYSVPAVAMIITAEVAVRSSIAVWMLEKGAALPREPWEGDVIDEGGRQKPRKSWISSTKVIENQYKLPGTAITLFSHDLAQDGSCGREIQDVFEGDPWQEVVQEVEEEEPQGRQYSCTGSSRPDWVVACQGAMGLYTAVLPQPGLASTVQLSIVLQAGPILQEMCTLLSCSSLKLTAFRLCSSFVFGPSKCMPHTPLRPKLYEAFSSKDDDK